MWDLRIRNRGVFVLISVLSGCAVLYNAWGPILALTVSIILVIYVSYSLLTNDTILTPETLKFVKYIKEAGAELTAGLDTASFYLSSTARNLFIIFKNNYRTHVLEKMNRFRQSKYQLSNNETRDTRNSSRFDLTSNQLSPIPRNEFQENRIPFQNRLPNPTYSTQKHTSTPLLGPIRKDSPLPNGGIGLFTPNRPLRQDTQHAYGHNQSARSNETVFSPEGSPWGTSISPKIRSKGAGIKTVQTVAGPLLASTRYNIDPKVYSDVTSPGLSSRLAKYATEANTKLTHQPQYGTGQFPKVNLSASPLPLISMKNAAKIRSPVTVRIAPPDASQYSPPGRQKIISEVCRVKRHEATPSIIQRWKESLKRHASTEDVSADLVKKQRTEGLFEDNLDELEELTREKRTREDSPNTEEEILARNNQLRPVKKTKTPSCYDVLNSLSSSYQYSSGVKRKASTLDLSRSGTPDIEKHFKASETARVIPKVTINITEPETEVKKPQRNDLNEKSSQNMEVEAERQLLEVSVGILKGILKVQPSNDTVDQEQNQLLERHNKVEEKRESPVAKDSSPTKNKPVNFTAKLFMKAEPETNERLRTMIQEQGNIRAKFTSDDVDEIKKEDIVNMRQTSMRARLQSMFDAISGKPTKKINPDVIIHAEGASEPTAASTTPASLATLSSTTSTTNVNTSPIATSVIAPTVSDSKLSSTSSTKHVTFNLPTSQPSLVSTTPISSSELSKNTTESEKTNSEVPKLSFGTVVAVSTISQSSPNIQNMNPTSSPPSLVNSNVAPSSFGVLKSSVESPTTLGSQSLSITQTTSSGLNLPTSTNIVAKGYSPSSSTAFTSSNSDMPKPSTTFGSSTTSSVFSSGNFTSESNKPVENVQTSTQAPVSMPNFSFGASKMTPPAPAFGTNSQTATNIVSSAPATTLASVPSSVMPSNQSAFNTTSISGGMMAPANSTNSTISSLSPFGGTNTAPQSTSISFTTNTNNAVKGQVTSYGLTKSQSTLAFGTVAGVQSPPSSFGSGINFQSVQSSGNGSTTSAQNPPSFGSGLTSGQNPPAFGNAVMTTAQNAPTFGTVASSAPSLSFGTTSTTTSGFAFGGTGNVQTSSISGFGTTANSTATPATLTAATNPTFSFGTSAPPNAKPGFAFGASSAPTPASSGGIGTANQIPAFSANPGSNTSAHSAPVFGAVSTTAPPAFGSHSGTTAVPVFGAPSSTASVFGGISTTTAAPPAFGVTSSNTSTSLFGSPATTTSVMFEGAAPASGGFGTPKTTAPPAFGSHTTDSSFNYGGVGIGTSSLFAGTSLPATTNTAAPSTVSSNFGGNAAGKSIFGQAKSPPSFAASTSGSFGSGGTPNFGAANSAFGQANNNSGISNTANNPGFGTQGSTTQGFGVQNQTVKQTGQPQGPPPAFGATNSAFGTTTTAPPAFGANTATPSGFGTSTQSFGTQNSTAPPSFGASTGNTGTNAFGASSAAPFGAQNQGPPPAFGAQNSTAPSFGSTNNNTGGATFGFGNTQSQAQQNPGFPFSANTGNANNAATATPFQFGGAPAKPEGFNFNASTTAPNMNFGGSASSSFGTPTQQGSNMFGTASPAAPAGGMFSIGAGSTAPRSRTTRTRRQR